MKAIYFNQLYYLKMEIISNINSMMLVSVRESLSVALVIIVVLFLLVWFTKMRKEIISRI